MNRPIKLDDFPGMKRNIPLRGYSTLGVGGPADFFVECSQLDDLPDLLAAAQEAAIPYFILGGGSNVLFADEGFRGLVIRIAARQCKIEGDRIVADAGVTWPMVLCLAEEEGLGGIEDMAGLPGTIGGAVAGNAGCFGTEMADLLISARMYDPKQRRIQEVDGDYFEFGYRTSIVKQKPLVVLQATLQLTQKTNFPSSKTPQITQQKRIEKQPPGKSSGSFFKNPSPDDPEGKSAGWLIEHCGLKGFQIGGAQISPKHANFFMNVNGATAADILALRDRAKAAVKEKFDVDLHEEVVIISQ